MVMGDPTFLTSPEVNYFIFFVLPLLAVGFLIWKRMELMLGYHRETIKRIVSIHHIALKYEFEFYPTFCQLRERFLPRANQEEPDSDESSAETLTGSDSLTEDDES